MQLLSSTNLNASMSTISAAPLDESINLRIPRDGDQRSELMSITIPK